MKLLTHGDFFFLIFKFTRLCGLELGKDEWKIQWKKFLYWFSFVNLTIAMMIVNLAMNELPIDTPKIIFSAVCTALFVKDAIKWIFFGYKRLEISDLIEELKDFYPKCNNSLSLKYYENFKIFRNFNFALFIITVVPNQLVAIFSLIFNFKTIFLFDFPSYLYHPLIYPLINIWQWFSIIEFGAITYAVDLNTFTIALLLTLEFKILREDFGMLKTMKEEKVEAELIKLLEKQQKLLEISEKFNRIYKLYHLLYFISHFVILTLLTFEITISTKVSQMILLYAIIWLTQTLQLFSHCFFGQLLNSNSIISEGIYDCGWENFESLKLKKMVLFSLQNSQRSENLTLMSFGVISLSLFTDVSTFYLK